MPATVRSQRRGVRALRADLKESGALRFGEFTLTSGITSNYYVDVKRGATQPDVLHAVIEAMAPYSEGHNRLAGMELGAIPLIVGLTLETGLPYVMIRKAGRAHGTEKALEGPLDSGDRILLVEDVTTTGGSAARAVEVLRAAGGVVERVVCVVDREEGARERLAELGVELHPLLTSQQLLDAVD